MMHTGSKFLTEVDEICRCIECASARLKRSIRERAEQKLDAEREASMEGGE